MDKLFSRISLRYGVTNLMPETITWTLSRFHQRDTAVRFGLYMVGDAFFSVRYQQSLIEYARFANRLWKPPMPTSSALACSSQTNRTSAWTSCSNAMDLVMERFDLLGSSSIAFTS